MLCGAAPPEDTSVKSLEASVAALEQRVAELEARSAATEERLAKKEAESAIAKDDAAEKEPEESDAAVVEFSIGGSVWDAALVVGLSGQGVFASGMFLLSTLLNIFVQCYICIILLNSPSFVSTHVFSDLENHMHRWRLSTAHDLLQMDSEGYSLASRVCGEDPALSVSGAQASLVSQIREYLGQQEGAFNLQGPLLCAVCMFLFSVVVMKELRSVACQMLALLHLRGPGPTKMEGNTLVSISTGRFVCCFTLAVIRLFVAVVLLATGLLWLAATSSTTDLILNAAALSFVMDLDELVFETMVPAQVQRFVERVEPLRHRQFPFNPEALFPLLTSIALVLLCYFLLVGPNIQAMLRVNGALCNGNLDFVTFQSGLDYIIAKDTRPFNISEFGEARTEGLAQLAVEERRDRKDHPQYSKLIDSDDQFNNEQKADFRGGGPAVPCANLDTFSDGTLLASVPHWFTAAREMTGLNSRKRLDEVAWMCEDHAGFCQTHRLVRRLCPMTCGCADPQSGLLLTGTTEGCVDPCSSMMAESLRNISCTDMDPGNPAWKGYWMGYLEFIRRNIPDRLPLYEAFVDRKLADGCANTEIDPVAGHDFCDGEAPVLRGNGARSIVGYCPVTCCNRTNRVASCDAVRACPAPWR